MDEVDTIQNHLLSQAGEHTNIIMGLGYDNTLGDKIGITLIATGFDNKVETSGKEEKEQTEEKIILTLNVPEQKVAPKPEEEQDTDPLTPRLIQAPEEKAAKSAVQPELFDFLPQQEEKEIWHLSKTSLTSSPSIAIETSTKSQPVSDSAQVYTKDNNDLNKEASTTATSGGYLSKPSNIYAEEPDQLQSKTNDPHEEPLPVPSNFSSDGKTDEMHMVIKDPNAADKSGIEPAQNRNYFVEEPAMQDEAEEQKRKAAERLNKLRNLSYNVNASDSNNEFETIPAYVRRNFQLKNALASVEKFYSNYSVKTDENNQTQISTINTFLDGKKPD